MEKPLKLTILSQFFYPQDYSTALSLTQLAEVLSEKGVDVKVYCGQPTSFDRMDKYDKYLVYKNIEINRVNNTQFSKKNIIGRLINDITFLFLLFFKLLFRKIEGPLLILTNPPLLGIVGVILKKIKKLTIIFLVFDVYPETAIKLGVIKEKGLLSKIWDKFNKFIFKNANFVVVIGRDMEKIIKRKFEIFKIKSNKIHYIPIWTDDKKLLEFSMIRNPLKEKWHLEGKFIVLYSGNLGRFHDLETIIASAKKINKIEKNIVFLFVGEGFKKRYVLNFINENNLKNCIVKGFVSREEHPLVLNLADIGIVSLLNGQEGFSVPSKTFSYWAMGKPVIAIMNKNSEIGQIINEYRSGFIVKNGDVDKLVEKILLLYNNTLLRNEMTNNSKNLIIEKYNLDVISDLYIKLLQ